MHVGFCRSEAFDGQDPQHRQPSGGRQEVRGGLRVGGIQTARHNHVVQGKEAAEEDEGGLFEFLVGKPPANRIKRGGA